MRCQAAFYCWIIRENLRNIKDQHEYVVQHGFWCNISNTVNQLTHFLTPISFWTLLIQEAVALLPLLPPLNSLLSNFNITLPFRGLKLPRESSVSWTIYQISFIVIKEYRNLFISNGTTILSLFLKDYRSLVDEVRNFYFGDNPKDDEAMRRYVDLLSDANYRYPITKATRIHAAKTKGKTYFHR